MAKKYKGTVSVAKMNMVKYREKPEEHKVEHATTIIFFREGKEGKRIEGYKYPEDLEKEIEGFLEG